jgi:hypothetical protein
MNCIKYLFCYTPPLFSVVPISVSNIEEYKDVHIEDAISFIPPIRIGKVLKIVDGNAILVAAKMPYPRSPFYQFVVRLKESGNEDASANETKRKNILHVFVLEQMVSFSHLEYNHDELYGYVYCNDICVNTFMRLKTKTRF